MDEVQGGILFFIEGSITCTVSTIHRYDNSCVSLFQKDKTKLYFYLTGLDCKAHSLYIFPNCSAITSCREYENGALTSLLRPHRHHLTRRRWRRKSWQSGWRIFQLWP
jgi:hypothetical protein